MRINKSKIKINPQSKLFTPQSVNKEKKTAIDLQDKSSQMSRRSRLKIAWANGRRKWYTGRGGGGGKGVGRMIRQIAGGEVGDIVGLAETSGTLPWESKGNQRRVGALCTHAGQTSGTMAKAGWRAG